MYRMASTDERMDDFAKHTARRFDEVDSRLDRLERRLDVGFDQVNSRIDDLHRIILQLGAGALVTFIMGFVGIIVTQP